MVERRLWGKMAAWFQRRVRKVKMQLCYYRSNRDLKSDWERLEKMEREQGWMGDDPRHLDNECD